MIKSFKQFKLRESAKKNCVYLHVMYAGGDADTQHPEYYLLKGITMDNIDEHLDMINKEIQDFKTLKKILSYGGRTSSKYDEIKDEYGDEIAILFDNTPNDPQADYQFKCYIDRIELHAYDDKGDLYTQYV